MKNVFVGIVMFMFVAFVLPVEPNVRPTSHNVNQIVQPVGFDELFVK